MAEQLIYIACSVPRLASTVTCQPLPMMSRDNEGECDVSSIFKCRSTLASDLKVSVHRGNFFDISCHILSHPIHLLQCGVRPPYWRWVILGCYLAYSSDCGTTYYTRVYLISFMTSVLDLRASQYLLVRRRISISSLCIWLMQVMVLTAYCELHWFAAPLSMIWFECSVSVPALRKLRGYNYRLLWSSWQLLCNVMPHCYRHVGTAASFSQCFWAAYPMDRVQQVNLRHAGGLRLRNPVLPSFPLSKIAAETYVMTHLIASKATA